MTTVVYNFFNHTKKLGPAWTDGFYINLDIDSMIRWAESEGVSFEHAFSEAVSHEYLHCLFYQILCNAEWPKAFEQFDNICSNKMHKILEKKYGICTPRVQLNYWRGGLPWPIK